MKPPYHPTLVANQFLRIAEQNREKLTPMKLQKLVYFAHGWFLVLAKGIPLIDEPVEAWEYGPVIPSLYHEFKRFGKEHIIGRATGIRTEGKKVFLFTRCIADGDPTPERELVLKLLSKIWEVYGGFSAMKLSNLTHHPGSPWEQVRSRPENKGLRGVDIPNEVIQRYFERIRSGSKQPA